MSNNFQNREGRRVPKVAFRPREGGALTVPQVFLDGRRIGGAKELQTDLVAT